MRVGKSAINLFALAQEHNMGELRRPSQSSIFTAMYNTCARGISIVSSVENFSNKKSATLQVVPQRHLSSVQLDCEDLCHLTENKYL